MKNIRNLYKIKDKDIPPNLREYQNDIIIRYKREKSLYKEEVKRKEKAFLSFGVRNKNKIVGSGVSLLAILMCIGLLNNTATDNKNNILQSPDSIAVASDIEPHSEQDELEVSANKDEVIIDKDNVSENSDKKSQGKKAQKKGKQKEKIRENTISELKVGDIVMFSGKYQYKSSLSNKNRVKSDIGKAKITQINNEGLHRFHLIGLDSEQNIYGWVDEKDIKLLKSK